MSSVDDSDEEEGEGGFCGLLLDSFFLRLAVSSSDSVSLPRSTNRFLLCVDVIAVGLLWVVPVSGVHQFFKDFKVVMRSRQLFTFPAVFNRVSD